jgi:hypothetical protein
LINKLDVDHFEAERENAAARIAELKRHMIQEEHELSATLQGSCRWLVPHPGVWSRAYILKTEIV